MKQMIKKAIPLLLCFIFLLGIMPAFAIEGEIYRTSDQTTLAYGVTHTHTRIFTQKGWQNVNTVRANLSENPYIQAVPLYNQNGASVSQTVLNMAKDHDTLAAINADFFDRIPGLSGRVSPIGTIVEDGKVVSTPAHDPGFATFYTDLDGKPFFDYFTYSLRAVSPSGAGEWIKHMNKYNFNGDIVYLDRDWNAKSIGSTGGKFELVVQNDTVIEKRENQPPVDIPENGYVLNCSLSFSRFLIDFFSVGEKVVIEKQLTPDLAGIQTAVGTGSLILKDGQKTPITFDIAGINPRSAIGFDAAGNTLYLITVDGRQAESIGMTTPQMADFMLEMGITDGAILDGGGSTNLAVKDYESDQQQIANQPSESSRAVASGIGLKDTAPLSALKGIILFDDQQPMFVNSTKTLRAVGYDEYLHKIELDPARVTYQVSGVSGSVQNSVFSPTAAGTATITAQYDGVSGTKTIEVLSDPVYLSLPSGNFLLKAGETQNFEVKARDKNGISAPLPLHRLKVETQNGCVSFENHKLTGIFGGEDLITFDYNGLRASAKITVAGGAQTDSFETQNGFFTGYPSYVQGSYALSSEQAKSGSYSGKLTFDFTDGNDDVRAAYLEFSQGKALPADTEKITLWMHSGQDYGHMLRGMIYDADGSPMRISFTDRISAGGWQYFEAAIPKDLKYPARLSRVYVVQNDKAQKNAGSIYLDDLAIINASGGGAQTPVTDSPSGTVFHDAQNRAPGEADKRFSFSVYGAMDKKDTLLRLLAGKKLSTKISPLNLSVFLGMNYDNLEEVTNEKIVTYSYGASVYEAITMIRLDNSVDGLRKTNADQWSWFLNTLDNIQTKHVMIYLPRPASKEGFSDPLELNLFYEVLSKKLYETGKNAYVISAGSAVSRDIKDGVRYFTTAPLSSLTLSNLFSGQSAGQYFEFTLTGDALTYAVKSIF